MTVEAAIGDTSEVKTQDWKSLIGRVLALRDDPRNAGTIAGFRAGISPSSETFAMGYTDRFLSDLSLTQRSAARRAAAICASNPRVRQPENQAGEKAAYRPLGHSLRDLVKRESNGYPSPESPNAITMQVNSLPLVDAETAATIFGLLVSRCAEHNIAVDYYDLTKTLIYWGNGISQSSLRARRSVITAFYEVPESRSKRAHPKNSSTETE